MAALLLAQAAVRASRLNIIANMKEVQDEKLRKRWVNEATRLEKQVNELVETLLPQTEARLTADHSHEKPAVGGGAHGRFSSITHPAPPAT